MKVDLEDCMCDIRDFNALSFAPKMINRHSTSHIISDTRLSPVFRFLKI